MQMLAGETPFARCGKLPLQLPRAGIDGIKIAIIAPEINDAILNRWRGHHASSRLEFPLLGARRQLQRVEITVGAAHIRGGGGHRWRRKDVAVGVKPPFNPSELRHTGSVINARMTWISAKHGRSGILRRNCSGTNEAQKERTEQGRCSHLPTKTCSRRGCFPEFRKLNRNLITVYFAAAQASPSGFLPVPKIVVSSVFRSMATTTFLALTATNAREPSGAIRMPAEPPPKLKDLSSLCVATSKITKLALEEPPNPPETNACLPSRVNFRRLPRTEIGKVCSAFFVVTSMMVTVPSCALAAQICLPSGERSKPSEPRPDGTLVIRHVFRGGPGGGLAGGAEPAGAPGGGPKLGMGASTCSTMLMVPEFTLEVKTVLSFGEKMTI